MKESEIDWNNVKHEPCPIADKKFTFKLDNSFNSKFYNIESNSFNFKLKYEVLEFTSDKDGTYYQTIIQHPFRCKSSWLKCKPKDLEEYAIKLLERVLKTKYKDVLTRDYNNKKSFAKYLEIIGELSDKKDDLDTKKEFSTKLNHNEAYKKINKKRIGNIWKEIIEGIDKNNFTDLIEDKEHDIKLTWDKFVTMLIKDNCGYCGISIEQINELSSIDELYTKRSRGYTLEVDQIDAYGHYSDDNCIASCYWCNNAKTDEFTKKDFEPIALAIRSVWNSRLPNI